MTETFAELSEEHRNILSAIDLLLEKCATWHSGARIDSDFFGWFIEFVRGYADRFHHAKEEDILFVELVKEGALPTCNPTQQMLYEHDLGRQFIREMEKSWRAGDGDGLVENARGYAQLLQEHIFKEDNILYPLAEETLSPKVKAAMLKRFAQSGRQFAQERKKYLPLRAVLKSKRE